MENNEQGKLSFLYQEYTRIANRIDTIVDGSFTDFKMLGVIGAILGCHPMIDAIEKLSDHDLDGSKYKILSDESAHAILLLMGFIAILIFTSIMAIRYLTKYNIINKLLKEMKNFEVAINNIIGTTDSGTFNLASNWLEKEEKTEGHHRKIVQEFYLLFCSALLIFPITIFTMEYRDIGPGIFPVILLYLLAFAICVCIVVNARIEINKELDIKKEHWSVFARTIDHVNCALAKIFKRRTTFAGHPVSPAK